MGRLLAWISGAVSGIAAYKLLTRRRPTAALPAPPLEPPTESAAPDPRADALRAKLEAREEAPPEPDAAPSDPDARRAQVHEDARATVERMRRSSGA
jgi:hypothetical protein